MRKQAAQPRALALGLSRLPPVHINETSTLHRKLLGLLFVATWLVPAIAGPVTDEDFEVKTTRNLLNLCTVSANDPRHEEVIPCSVRVFSRASTETFLSKTHFHSCVLKPGFCLRLDQLADRHSDIPSTVLQGNLTQA